MELPGGPYEILICRFATAPNTLSGLYLNHHLYGEPDEGARTDYYVWIIRNRERTILVDTGFSRATGERRDKTVFRDVPDIWREHGVDPNAPQELVVTHFHYDHVGNVRELADPRVWASRAELEFWGSDDSEGFLISFYSEEDDQSALRALAERGAVREVVGRAEVAPGVQLIEVGGHTPGQTMVLVTTSIGKVLLASDAVHFHKELDEDKPFTAVTDLPGLYRGLRVVREMVASGEVVLVVTGHDPAELDERAGVTILDEHTAVVGALGD